MRDAMANAVVGDDMYDDDPTTKKLEKDMAEVLGKEAALLTPSGVQANTIAMMVAAPKRGDCIVMGNQSHLMHYERGGLACAGGVLPWIVKNLPDGTMPLDEIAYPINNAVNEHIPPVTGISLESSMNNCSGKVLRMDYISKVKKLAKKRKCKMHLDGARSWNAAMYLGLEMKEMMKDFDIVNVCLSKGLGCPIGSIIAGTEKDMIEARNIRKMLGGAMR